LAKVTLKVGHGVTTSCYGPIKGTGVHNYARIKEGGSSRAQRFEMMPIFFLCLVIMLPFAVL